MRARDRRAAWSCCWPSAASRRNEPKADDRQTLRAVALPDLSRLEESVQAQLRERYAALTAKQTDPATPAADLGTEYGEMGKLLMAAEFRDPAEAVAPQCAGARAGRHALAVLSRALVQDERGHPEGDGRLRAGAAVGAQRRADDGLARQRRLSIRDDRTPRNRSSRRRCRFSLARSRRTMASDARRWPRQDYARAAQTSRAGARARQQSIDHPLFAGDGVPWPGRPSQGGSAPAAARHAADSARPVEEGARRAAPQRADLRDERRRRRQQRRVGRRGGVSPEGRGPGPDAGVAASQAGHGAVLHGRPARRVRTVPGGRAAVADASPPRITPSA